MAWRTELRLTPNVSVNSCSEGSFSPSFQVPWRIWSRSCSKTFSAIFTRVICLRAIKSTVPFVKVWYVWKMHTILYKIILTNTSIVKAGFRPKSRVFCTGPRKSIHSSLNTLPHILFLLSREDQSGNSAIRTASLITGSGSSVRWDSSQTFGAKMILKEAGGLFTPPALSILLIPQRKQFPPVPAGCPPDRCRFVRGPDRRRWRRHQPSPESWRAPE